MPNRKLTVGKLTTWIVLSLAIANVAQLIATALGRREGLEWVADCVPRTNGHMSPDELPDPTSTAGSEDDQLLGAVPSETD